MRILHQTLIFLFFILFGHLSAQTLEYTGPVGAALGQQKVFDNSPWSSINNVANLGSVNYYSAGISYQRRFNMDELSSKLAVFTIPSRFGTLAGLVFQNGYSKSNYSRFGISYSRLFGDKVAAGLQFNYLNHQMISADAVGAFYSSIGINFSVSEKFALGIYIQNPEQAKLSYIDADYQLPSFFNTAIKYRASSHVLFLLELEKQQTFDLVYKCGIELNFKNELFVRSGIRAKPVEYSFGGGFKVVGLTIDVGFLYHQQLGLTSSAGIYYAINRKKH